MVALTEQNKKQQNKELVDCICSENYLLGRPYCKTFGHWVAGILELRDLHLEDS